MYMGYLKTMGAGLAGSTVRYKGVNVNQIQFGDKLQGLPPVTGTRRPHKIYKRKAGGQKPGRDTIFCINQLGGMMVKNSQFAANADGVKECSNRKNRRNHTSCSITNGNASAPAAFLKLVNDALSSDWSWIDIQDSGDVGLMVYPSGASTGAPVQLGLGLNSVPLQPLLKTVLLLDPATGLGGVLLLNNLTPTFVNWADQGFVLPAYNIPSIDTAAGGEELLKYVKQNCGSVFWFGTY